MSRFSHLEFGEKRDKGKPVPHGEAVRDAAFFGQRAQAAWLAGDFEEALRQYSRALEENSAFYDGWFGQVRMLIELGEYKEAGLWADKALEFFPEHPELLSAKAVASARDAELEKALAYSDNAISRDGATSYVWLARAETLLVMRNRMAESCVRNAIGISADTDPTVRLQAGRTLARNGSCMLALEYLHAAIGPLSKSALAWYELGLCQAELGLPEAAASLRQCLQLRPGWRLAGDALRRASKQGLVAKLRGAFRRLFGK